MAIESKIFGIIDGPLQGLGISPVQIRYIEGDKPKLEILIERLDGEAITVDDCARANRTISTHMDVEDPIAKAYLLEVSSAGIDRPLIGLKDYVRFVNYKISLQTKTPIEGVKKFKGLLDAVIDNKIVIKPDQENAAEIVEIEFDNIHKGKLDLDFMIDLKLKERKAQK